MDSERDRTPIRWTDREREVLNLLAEGKTNAEIAAELDISFATAKWHVSEVLSKLGVESRADAAHYWRRERGVRGRARRAPQWIMGGIALRATATAVALAAAGLAIAGVVILARGGPQTRAGRSATGTPGALIDEWAPLRRPIQLPVVSPGQQCPVSSVASHTPFLGAGAGKGPFFVTLASVSGRSGVMDYGLGDVYGGDWGGEKTLWYVDPGQYPRACHSPRPTTRRAR